MYSSNATSWSAATTSASFGYRVEHASVVFNNKMWVFGGYDISGGSYCETCVKNDIWYSSVGTNWTRHSDNASWSARAWHSAVVYNNKIFIIGGGQSNPNKDVWYSSDGLNWTEQSPSELSSASMRQPNVFVFDNKIWLMGGDKEIWNYAE